MKYDIEINGTGFYQISAGSDAGYAWLTNHVIATRSFVSSNALINAGMTKDIADGAIEDGMRVRINGRKYLGNNRCAKKNPKEVSGR